MYKVRLTLISISSDQDREIDSFLRGLDISNEKAYETINVEENTAFEKPDVDEALSLALAKVREYENLGYMDAMKMQRKQLTLEDKHRSYLLTGRLSTFNVLISDPYGRIIWGAIPETYKMIFEQQQSN